MSPKRFKPTRLSTTLCSTWRVFTSRSKTRSCCSREDIRHAFGCSTGLLGLVAQCVVYGCPYYCLHYILAKFQIHPKSAECRVQPPDCPPDSLTFSRTFLPGVSNSRTSSKNPSFPGFQKRQFRPIFYQCFHPKLGPNRSNPGNGGVTRGCPRLPSSLGTCSVSVSVKY